MKKINKFQLRKELRKNFAFYDMYKLYLELTYLEMSCDELEIMFEIIHKGQLLHIEEKTYSEVERYYFIRENFNKINLSLLDYISNDNVLIMPTNPKYKLFPRIKGLQKKVKELCPLLIKQRNVNGVKVYKQEISEKLLIQFAIIPFAFSYMDINIIPYKSNHFYFINHHMDIFEVQWKKNEVLKNPAFPCQGNKKVLLPTNTNM